MSAPVALLVAKAPVPGQVKTRLGAEIGMVSAAGLAAAALLDTIAACASAFGAGRCHLALDGVLHGAHRRDEILEALTGWTLHRQRGKGFAARLARAHEDVAAATGAPVVQIGMDTPQVAPADLASAAERLTGPSSAVLGPASDGGWWLLGVARPQLVDRLRTVPMSTTDTGLLTREALRASGAEVEVTQSMRDVDRVADAVAVAAIAPETRFARAWSVRDPA